MNKQANALILMLLVAACGDDGGGGAPGGQPGAPGAPAPAPAAAAPGGPKKPLTPQVHIEDRVAEAERAAIRHQFRERDFATESNRDPFSSTILITYNPNVDVTRPPPKPVECKSALIASNYSYADLRLVGIVAQGTQRKVLMMDPGNLGRIIKAGDCVGKEKALVKEIGTGYLTFVVTAEAGGPGKQARTDEHSIPLHNNDLDVSLDLSQPTPEGGAPEAAPVVPSTGTPNGGLAPSGGPNGNPNGGTGTRPSGNGGGLAPAQPTQPPPSPTKTQKT